MQRFKGLILYAISAALILLLYYATPLSKGDLFDGLSSIETQVHENIFGASILFFLSSAVLTYFAFPSMPLVYMAAGYCLDSVSGGIIVWLGSAIGGLGAFLLYRKHIPHRHRLHPQQHSALKLWLALLGLRLSPIVPAPIVNFFAAFFSVSAIQYITTTLLGSAPLILFYELVGQQGHNYVYGEQIQWWHFSGYLAILAFSTFLSSLGPWRSFLTTIKRLKSEVFASMRQSARANWAPPNTAGQTGD